jgi:hypothetical protein
VTYLLKKIGLGIFSVIIVIATIHSLIYKQKRIEKIYYQNSSFGYIYLASEIDFTKNIGRRYTVSNKPEYRTFEEIDTEAFSIIKIKNSKKIQEKLYKTGFSHWKNDYVNPNIFDGYQWSVTIHYEDGTTKYIRGSNDKPIKLDEFEKIVMSDV